MDLRPQRADANNASFQILHRSDSLSPDKEIHRLVRKNTCNHQRRAAHPGRNCALESSRKVDAIDRHARNCDGGPDLDQLRLDVFLFKEPVLVGNHEWQVTRGWARVGESDLVGGTQRRGQKKTNNQCQRPKPVKHEFLRRVTSQKVQELVWKWSKSSCSYFYNFL